ncbi:hypothetical protein QJQ45_029212, partial [Haematococcus lacustris]
CPSQTAPFDSAPRAQPFAPAQPSWPNWGFGTGTRGARMRRAVARLLGAYTLQCRSSGAQPASPVLQLAGGGHLRVVRHITTEELRRGGITKLLVANRGEIALWVRMCCGAPGGRQGAAAADVVVVVVVAIMVTMVVVVVVVVVVVAAVPCDGDCQEAGSAQCGHLLGRGPWRRTCPGRRGAGSASPATACHCLCDAAGWLAQAADEAVCIGGTAARDSYLRADAVLAAAKATGATAIHPGFGFLSENAAFAERCAEEGVKFVGPPASAIRSMGDKAVAKAVMAAAGVPVVPGYHGEDQSLDRLMHEASVIGFPLLVKAVSGGGGKGMKLAMRMEEVAEALASARREAAASFGDDRLLLERYITRPRHVEVQVVCDAHGQGVYLFDRDCSVQRRHQKAVDLRARHPRQGRAGHNAVTQEIIEEAPAPGLPGAFHALLGEAAVRAAQATGYVNAGTVEFIVDVDSAPWGAAAAAGSGRGPPRLLLHGDEHTAAGDLPSRSPPGCTPVEHPVTEAVAGVDLVAWQLAVAAGQDLPLTQQQVFHGSQVGGAGPWGHAFEARLYAESPRNNFLPALLYMPPLLLLLLGGAGGGTVQRWRPPPQALAFTLPPAGPPEAPSAAAPYVRVDSGVREGDTAPPGPPLPPPPLPGHHPTTSLDLARCLLLLLLLLLLLRVSAGGELQVGSHYDPMIAKIISWGPDRDSALNTLRSALANTQVAGLATNLAYLQRLAAHPAFIAGELDTGFVPRHKEQLLAPLHLPPKVAALAAVARRLLKLPALPCLPSACLLPACPCRGRCGSSSSRGAQCRGGGAWSVLDSTRVGHAAVKVVEDMGFPEGELPSAAAARLAAAQEGDSSSSSSSGGGGGGGGQGGLTMHMTLLSGTDMDIEVSTGARTLQQGGSGGSGGSSGVAGGVRVAVRGALLTGDQVEAEVDSHRWGGGGRGPRGRSLGSLEVCNRFSRGSLENLSRISRGSLEGLGLCGLGCVRREALRVSWPGVCCPALPGPCRLSASVACFSRGREQVLCLWLKGWPDMYEFRWPLPQWSRMMAEGQGGRGSQGAASARPGAVLAPLPGRIVKLLVKEGEQVGPGQGGPGGEVKARTKGHRQVVRGAGLAVVEAMKMEHLVVAERAGRVQGLGVEPGSQVADGQELMRLVAAQ